VTTRFGSLRPALDLARENGRGVFVLALTSNKEGPQVQHARGVDGLLVAQSIIDEVASRNLGAKPLGSFGVVVGATIGDSVAELAGLNGPYLVPGVGAQGGTADDIRRIFGAGLSGVLPSVSREVLRSGPSEAGLREAAQRLVQEFQFLRS